jgi:hypothetical protein
MSGDNQFRALRKQMYPTSRSELTTKEKTMTKDKNDVPNPEGGNQEPRARGGVPSEDRAKDLTDDQAGGPLGKQPEGNAAGEKKPSGERK